MKLSCALMAPCCFFAVAHAAFFVPKVTERQRETRTTQASSALLATTLPDKNDETKSLDVVLFGIGDLRVDDHAGLVRAFQQTDNVVLPLFLWNDEVIRSIPGAVAHTYDTASMLSVSLEELDQSLKEINPDLALHTCFATDSMQDALEQLVQDLKVSPGSVRIRVCDLGKVDNTLGYGTFCNFESNTKYKVSPWHSSLRDDPWKDLTNLPTSYPDYQQKYSYTPKDPVALEPSSIDSNRVVSIPKFQSIPSSQQILNRMIQVLNLDPARVDAEANTGIYGTHWGGLLAKTVGCKTVLSKLQYYTEDCDEDEEVWCRHPAFVESKGNRKSLEHSAMDWQLNGGLDNWLAGEHMTRYLAAPLLFGTASPRRIWHLAKSDYILFESPLRKLVETQDWHRLLAAHYEISKQNNGKTRYKYWRYHGYLCRYAETKLDAKTSSEKQGLLLVHGFGASGSQWNKAMEKMSMLETPFCEGLAPDLLGFGQSEKPSISYTGYMWCSMMLDFAKEIAMQKNGWESYVTGGNSIGGFTSMSLAACDSATTEEISSSGAPGTACCQGLVLMNSAGPVLTLQELEKKSADSDGELQSVASVTASMALPLCSPPPRPVGRAFGNALLTYLRPRIQSICKNLYPTNPAAVDDDLCESILRDSLDPGAIAVMQAGAKLPAPRTANELLAADFGSADHEGESQFRGPVLIAQGILDPLNDAKDRMERYGALRSGITLDPIEAGHCPHDELPDQVAKSIASWMSSGSVPPTTSGKVSMSSIK